MAEIFPHSELYRTDISIQDYNKKIAKLIHLLQAEEKAMRRISAIKEEMGQWYELLESRIRKKITLDGLFLDLNQEVVPLTPENHAAIVALRSTLYPSLLCGLAKCYCKTERFQDAEDVLLEARSLGSQGAEVLLFYLYAQWLENPRARKLLDSAFEQVKNVDFFSETVTRELNSNAFQRDAAVLYFNLTQIKQGT